MYCKTLPLAAALTIAGATGASAAHLDYFSADVMPLNDSGASARASLVVDAITKTLRVRMLVRGVEPNLHPQHIHGPLGEDGRPTDAATPPPSADQDGDGFVEIPEGALFYGPILVPLVDGDGMFPTPSDTGYDFRATYDLTDPATYADGFGLDDLLGVGDTLEIDDDPMLELREIVIHGLTVPDGVGEGENFAIGDLAGSVDGGENGYLAGVPIAAGEIVAVDAPAPVPLPAAAWAMLAGLGGLGALRRLRRA